MLAKRMGMNVERRNLKEMYVWVLKPMSSCSDCEGGPIH